MSTKFPEDVKAYAVAIDEWVDQCLALNDLDPESEKFQRQSEWLDKVKKAIEKRFPWCTEMKHTYLAYCYINDGKKCDESVAFADEYNRWTENELRTPTQESCQKYMAGRW